MTSKKVIIGAVVAALLLVVCVSAIFATNWDNYTTYDTPQEIPFTEVVDDEGHLDESSLNYVLFEQYGPLLLIVGLLMFGAIIGGVCIAREESEHDDTN